MPSDIVMPRLSDTMEEGTILRWLKHSGDSVKRGDALAEVETDKANMEVEAFEDGTMGEILAQEGESVPVGEPIARLNGAAEAQALEPPPEAEEVSALPETPAPAAEQAPAMAPEVGRELPQPEAKAEEGEEGPQRVVTQTAEETPEKVVQPQPAPPSRRRRRPEREEAVKASPLARKLAEAYGLDLSQIQGSGPEGRIIERDVDAAIQEQRREAHPRADRQAVVPRGEVKPLSRMRQAIAQRMTQSKQQAPHFYVTMSVKADALVAMQARFEGEAEHPVTLTHLILKACARVLREHPQMNAGFQDGQILHYPDINIAIAVAVPEGLLTPVLHGVDRLSLEEIVRQSHALFQRVRENRLAQDDLSGGTFTLSNMGMFGVDEFSAIINPPQAAILAVGSAQEVPVVEDGRIVPGRRMKLTLSADHRVLNGVEAAEFLGALRRLLENPLLMML